MVSHKDTDTGKSILEIGNSTNEKRLTRPNPPIVKDSFNVAQNKGTRTAG